MAKTVAARDGSPPGSPARENDTEKAGGVKAGRGVSAGILRGARDGGCRGFGGGQIGGRRAFARANFSIDKLAARASSFETQRFNK